MLRVFFVNLIFGMLCGNHILISLLFQARVALYYNGSNAEIFSPVFNATKSSKLNWLAKNRLTHSPWIDLNLGCKGAVQMILDGLQ